MIKLTGTAPIEPSSICATGTEDGFMIQPEDGEYNILLPDDTYKVTLAWGGLKKIVSMSSDLDITNLFIEMKAELGN